MAIGMAAMLGSKLLKSKSISKLSKKVLGGKKGRGKKKSAAWYARETQRLKYKARYNKAKMRAVW